MSIPEEHRRLPECSLGASNQWAGGRDRLRVHVLIGMSIISLKIKRSARDSYTQETYRRHHFFGRGKLVDSAVAGLDDRRETHTAQLPRPVPTSRIRWNFVSIQTQ